MNALKYRMIIAASIIAMAGLFVSCQSTKPSMAIPDEFSRQAIKMPVNGIGNGSGRRPITIGEYKSSRIGRGWNFTTANEDRPTSVTVQERVFRAFGFDRNTYTYTQKDRFHFTLQGDAMAAEVYAMERTVTEKTQITTNNKHISELGFLKNAQYSFSAVIINPQDEKKEPWQLTIYATRDPRSRGNGNLFESNAWEEGGFLSNGKDTMLIRAVKIDKVVSAGKQATMPFAVLKAYEFRIGDAVTAILDTFGSTIWVYDQLGAEERFLIATASSAILLRRNAIF